MELAVLVIWQKMNELTHTHTHIPPHGSQTIQGDTRWAGEKEEKPLLSTMEARKLRAHAEGA